MEKKDIQLINLKGCKQISKEIENNFMLVIDMYNKSVEMIDEIEDGNFEIMRTEKGVDLSANLVATALVAKRLHLEVSNMAPHFQDLVKDAEETKRAYRVGLYIRYLIGKNKRLAAFAENVRDELELIIAELESTIGKMDKHIESVLG